MRTIALVAALSSVLLPVGAGGARFPNAVERTVTITGDAAGSLARLLGLSGEAASSVPLALGRNDAWAVYLLKHDTKREITNGDGPPRYNLAKFTAGAHASLAMGPYWLDLGTAAPATKPGYYSFGSPFIAEALTGNDSWTKLVRALRKEPGWNRGAQPQFRRCVTSAEQTEICIRVYGDNDYAGNAERDGYEVTITAHQSR